MSYNNPSFDLELLVENDVNQALNPDEIESLKEEILNTDRSTKVIRRRQTLSPEEAGGGLLMSILEVSLNPAVLALAVKVIHDWFRYKTAVEKRPIKILFKTNKGEFLIETEKEIDVEQIIQSLKKMMDGTE